MKERYTIQEKLDASIRLKNDINGNPRFYIPCYYFSNGKAEFRRPNFANKYRGRQYGAGWVFQSYNLKEELKLELKKHFKSLNTKYTSFIDDAEKMADFKQLSKEDFLNSYSYLNEIEYDLTLVEETNDE